MELIRRIDSLINMADKEDLEIIQDSIFSFTSYISSIVQMETGTAIARIRSNSQEELVGIIERLDKSRRSKHNSAIVSVKILNRLCTIYDVEVIYEGSIDDRQEVAGFAKELVISYYNKQYKTNNEVYETLKQIKKLDSLVGPDNKVRINEILLSLNQYVFLVSETEAGVHIILKRNEYNDSEVCKKYEICLEEIEELNQLSTESLNKKIYNGDFSRSSIEGFILNLSIEMFSVRTIKRR